MNKRYQATVGEILDLHRAVDVTIHFAVTTLQVVTAEEYGDYVVSFTFLNPASGEPYENGKVYEYSTDLRLNISHEEL